MMVYGSCCVLGDVKILKPLDIALNDGFRIIFDILCWVSVSLILKGFNVLPELLKSVVRNLFLLVQNMLNLIVFKILLLCCV